MRSMRSTSRSRFPLAPRSRWLVCRAARKWKSKSSPGSNLLAQNLFSPMKAKVIVMPKQSVLDPQGVAVREAIHHHGLPGVKSVRIGKFIELELDGSQSEAQLHDVCRDLLSNPVIEDYELTIS